MNMKRIMFFGVAILIIVVILGWILYSMSHIDEINQKRHEKDRGEALASQIIATTATTSIWDALRPAETESTAQQANPQNPEGVQPDTAPNNENQEENSFPEENAPSAQTFTETVQNPPSEEGEN